MKHVNIGYRYRPEKSSIGIGIRKGEMVLEHLHWSSSQNPQREIQICAIPKNVKPLLSGKGTRRTLLSVIIDEQCLCCNRATHCRGVNYAGLDLFVHSLEKRESPVGGGCHNKWGHPNKREGHHLSMEVQDRRASKSANVSLQ